MSDFDVIVIGGGLGGLTAGSILAKEGRSVLLLEQGDQVGGCCSTFERKGFRFDLGASIVEAVDAIDVAFQRMGSSLWKEVETIACDPVFDVIQRDGRRLKIPASSDETARLFGSIDAADGKAWGRYAGQMQGFVDAAIRGFFLKPAGTLPDLVRMFAETPALLRFGSLFVRSYEDVMRQYFKNERIREALAFHPFYTGLPPELAPAYYAMLPYSEHKGMYYAKTGMSAIPEAMKRLGEQAGMQTRLNARVKKVLVEKGHSIGVELMDGTQIRSKLVVSNINAKTLYLNLIGEEHLPWLAKVGIKSYRYSIASPMIYLGLNYTPPLESHHTLATLPLDDTNAYWNDSYLKGHFPTEQFGIISWTTRSDPGLAPQGKHVIVLTLAPGPYKLARGDWDSRKNEIMEKVIEFYSERYIPGLKDHVEVAEFATPVDFERRLLSPEGAIYALRQDVTNATCFRPSAKSRSIKGLYLTGASTHPGGGVPTVMASGVIAADLIAKYED